MKEISTGVYRVSEPVALWSASIEVSTHYDNFVDVATRIGRSRRERLTGYIERQEDGDVASFTRTRYPRLKYGVASIEDCYDGMERLALALQRSYNLEQRRTGFRVVMGLLEGYDPASRSHSLQEVKERLPKLMITGAEIFAARPTEVGVDIYTEPAAVIIGPTLRGLQSVKTLANDFRQERFCVEDFRQHQTYMVETGHCTEPEL